MEKSKEYLATKLDILIRLYTIYSERIEIFREYPSFTNVLSSEEIRAINLLGRSIPGKIESIRVFKESDAIREIRNRDDFNRARGQVRQIEQEADMISSLLDQVQAKFPKIKTPWAIALVFFPVQWISSGFSNLWQHLVGIKLGIELRILLYRRKRIIRKKIALGLELSQDDEDFLKRQR